MLRMQTRVFSNTKKAFAWFRSVYLPVTSQSLKDKILSENFVSQVSVYARLDRELRHRMG